jgi:hypothetical protein
VSPRAAAAAAGAAVLASVAFPGNPSGLGIALVAVATAGAVAAARPLSSTADRVVFGLLSSASGPSPSSDWSGGGNWSEHR